MDKPLRLLVIEDLDADFLLIERHLRQHLPTAVCRRVSTREALTAALADGGWDAALADYSVPGMSFRDSLSCIQARRPELPVILVSGSVGEETAVELMKQGVSDFVLKESLVRLVPAIRRSLEEATERQARRAVEEALRESEAMLRQSQRVASVGHYVLDVTTGRWASSEMLEEIFGIRADYPRDVAGWLRLVHPDDRAQMQDYLRSHARGDQVALDWEYRIVPMRDQTVRWVHGRGTLESGPDGQPVRMFGTIQDITERKQAEAERAALEAQLRQAQKMESIGRLAGGVAHDFNNLLSAILGYAELLQEELGPGDPRQADLAAIRHAGERARDLTRQLLVFSRKQVLSLRPVDLRAVVSGFDKLLRRTLREDIQLVIALPPALGTVSADAGQIEQVLMNLAVNAQDAMPSGGTLTLELADVGLDAAYAAMHAGVTPGRYIQLTVSDTGIGMDASTLSHLFEPFFTTKEHGKGTGLGLSTVYGIVEQHGGHIRVYSEPDRGTTFKIYLPQVEVPRTGSVISAQGEPPLPRGTGTVLVVEDDPSVREMACQVLERQGYRVLAAESSSQALQLMTEPGQGAMDLLLTDVVLPGMNGRALYDRLTFTWPHLRVVYMSGYPENVIAHHGVFEKGAHYLQKPFAVKALLQKVRDVLAA